MNEYGDPLMPKDLARLLMASEQNLHLRHQAWEAKLKELRSALGAVANEILDALPERTRAEHALEVFWERVPTYQEWYDVAHERSRSELLWRIKAYSPFGRYWYDFIIAAPDALAALAAPAQVAIRVIRHGTNAWTHEFISQQGSYILAVRNETGSEILSGISARTVAIRIWQAAVTSVIDHSLAGD